MKRLLVLSAILFLASCAFITEEYFHPNATGATIGKQDCRGQVGVDNQLVYNFGDVLVNLSVLEVKSGTLLTVKFTIFKGGSAIWPSQAVTVYVDGATTTFEPESFASMENVGSEFDFVEYPIGVEFTHAGQFEDKSYHESLKISDNRLKKVKIESIRVLINGEDKLLTDMVFNRRKGTFLHPLNC